MAQKEKCFKTSFAITDDAVRAFAQLTGDIIPFHLDDTYAANTIFKERICHGMLMGSYIGSVIGSHFPGFGTIYLSQTLYFRKPVKPGDTVIVTITVKEMLPKERVKLDTRCTNQHGECVVGGEAAVIPPSGFITR